MKKSILTAIVVAILSYLLGCLSEASFNILDWRQDVRQIVAVAIGLMWYISLFLLPTLNSKS